LKDIHILSKLSTIVNIVELLLSLNYSIIDCLGFVTDKKCVKISTIMVKRTYQPKKKKRVRVHGFRIRIKNRGGRAVLKRRRSKGRRKLTV